MKKFIEKYKEILISLIVILIIIMILLINFKSTYSKEYNIDIQNEQITENNQYNCEVSYYIKNGKLYDGENEINEFGDFSGMEDGPIQYLEFVDENNGFMYRIEDTAMTIAWGTISRTTNGGRTWIEVSNRN